MHLQKLSISQFRNYDFLDLDLSPGINVLTGNNGEGKTNVLESIHFLSMTRGFQAQGEKYAIQEGAPFFMCEGHWQHQDDAFSVQCNYVPGKGKKVLINGSPIRRLSEHIGRIPLIIVLPNDTQLIYGTPSLRRRFADAFISQYDPEYLRQLILYDKALTQRNAQLARFAEGQPFDPELLELWERQLIPAGQYIYKGRKDFLGEYAPLFNRYFHLIVSDQEQPIIEYKSQIQENSEEEWMDLYLGNREKERYSQRTAVGIHKDDLTFLIDGNPVKNFGSQGQQKTFLISLKLAQYEMLCHRNERPPLLLLDDIFDKLDMNRLSSIAGILEKEVEGQVFITDTSLDRTQQIFAQVQEREVRFYTVSEGEVTSIDKL